MSQKTFSSSPLYWRWHNYPASASFPRGESLSAVASRIDSFISECCLAPTCNVVISHTTPLQVIMTRLLGLDLNAIWRFYFAYYHLTIIHGHTVIAMNSLADAGPWAFELRE